MDAINLCREKGKQLDIKLKKLLSSTKQSNNMAAADENWKSWKHVWMIRMSGEAL